MTKANKLGKALPQDLQGSAIEITGTVSLSFVVTNESDYQLVRQAFEDIISWKDDCSMPSCNKVKTNFTSKEVDQVWNDHINREVFDA